MDSQKGKGGSRLWGKGSGGYGCLLNGDNSDSPHFIGLSLPFDFQVSAMGLTSSLIMAVTSQGELYIWGSIDKEMFSKPVRVLDKVSDISCGWNHSLMQKEGKIYGMGCNNYLQLGSPLHSKYLCQPVLIWSQPVDYICAGFRQSYIVSAGNLYGCGESKKYQLGIANPKPSQWRLVFENLSAHLNGPISRLVCGKKYLLILDKKGSVYGLGCNQGNSWNNSEVHFSMEPLKIFEGVRDVGSGWATVVLLTNQGTILTYGKNNLGQLGHQLGSNEVAVQLEKDQSLKSLSIGTQFSFTLTSKGKVIAWGWNEHTNLLPSPQQIIQQAVQVPTPGRVRKVWTHPATTIIQLQSGQPGQ